MSVQTNPYPTFINGKLAKDSELIPLAFSGFAHFTAMQVPDGRVKGLDLHLSKLRDASVELFGAALPDEKIVQMAPQVRCDLRSLSMKDHWLGV